MAYRFKLSEAFDDGVRRIGLQQIDRVIEQLNSAEDAATSIHTTRKGLKRIRALLRLARPGLGDEVYRTENARYRDIGRLLAEARDRKVLMDTVHKLEGAATGRTKTAFTAARTRLAHGGSAAAGDQHSAVIQKSLVALDEARAAMVSLPLDGSSFDTAWEGLARAYRQASRAFDHAFEKLDSDSIHEYRKRVQAHWRHMALLSPAWPELIGARVSTARHLSNLLGEDHDIAVMMETLSGQGETATQTAARKGAEKKLASHAPGDRKLTLTPAQRKLALAFATGRQENLRRTAHTLGRRLFAESADAFAERMKLYWISALEAHDEAHAHATPAPA